MNGSVHHGGADRQDPSATPQDDNAQNGQPREKRSRDRYGRERGPRADRGDRPDSAPAEAQQALEGFHPDTPVGASLGSDSSFEKNASTRQDARYDERPAMRSYFSDTAITAPSPLVPAAMGATAITPVTAAAMPAPDVAAAAPVVVAPPPTIVQAVAPKAIAAAGPIALPKVQSFTLPIETLNQVAQGSGLSWVNSDTAKVAQVQAAIAAEAKPIHVPRVRAVVAPADASPLVLVETKRDLRSLQLPFEETRPD